VVDGWLRLRGWARIGVLVSRLRGVIDQLIARKVENPDVASTGGSGGGGGGTGSSAEGGGGAGDGAGEAVIKLVVKLIELDGLDA